MGTIIRMTFLEMRKKKILYLTLILTAIFLLLYGTALRYTYKALPSADTLVRLTISGQLLSMGIYAVGFITAFLSIFSSVGAIASEIEKGTYDAILSKPIARYEIVLGKFIGILFVLLLYVTFLFLSVLGLNILFGKGVVIHFSTGAIIKSLTVFYLLPILLTAIGMFLSVSLSTIGSGVILVILYFCGMVGGIVEQIGFFLTDAATKAVLTNIGIITSLVIPSDIIYRKASALLYTTSSGFNMSLESMVGGSIQPSPFMMGYIVFYAVVMILLAVVKFKKRDL
ncbi:ABC transporter permease [Crassaminicella profunda]|uniref:ABC transporter permease n=1 Tax=Crassaminicella profunda TaxID=1286698 RepID=UPI001CA79E3D|nr:ABC transporter permease [Crassaminicella profunda]QZY55179.1 ABC transporter permease [Crassaminicella profunda]